MINFSKNHFLKKNGWSSHLFSPHFEKFFSMLETEGFEVKIRRTVIQILKAGSVFAKMYVHKNGDTKEWLTLIKQATKDQLRLHYKEEQIVPKIKDFLV